MSYRNFGALEKRQGEVEGTGGTEGDGRLPCENGDQENWSAHDGLAAPPAFAIGTFNTRGANLPSQQVTWSLWGPRRELLSLSIGHYQIVKFPNSPKFHDPSTTSPRMIWLVPQGIATAWEV